MAAHKARFGIKGESRKVGMMIKRRGERESWDSCRSKTPCGTCAECAPNQDGYRG